MGLVIKPDSDSWLLEFHKLLIYTLLSMYRQFHSSHCESALWVYVKRRTFPGPTGTLFLFKAILFSFLPVMLNILVSGNVSYFTSARDTTARDTTARDIEAAWPSGLGRWIWNLEVPGSNPPPYRYLDLFSVAPSSTPRPRCVNSQLVSLKPVGILNRLCSIWNICFSIYSVPN